MGTQGQHDVGAMELGATPGARAQRMNPFAELIHPVNILKPGHERPRVRNTRHKWSSCPAAITTRAASVLRGLKSHIQHSFLVPLGGGLDGVYRYEGDSAAPLGGPIKATVILPGLPTPIQANLQVQAGLLSQDYGALRITLQSYLDISLMEARSRAGQHQSKRCKPYGCRRYVWIWGGKGKDSGKQGGEKGKKEKTRRVERTKEANAARIKAGTAEDMVIGQNSFPHLVREKGSMCMHWGQKVLVYTTRHFCDLQHLIVDTECWIMTVTAQAGLPPVGNEAVQNVLVDTDSTVDQRYMLNIVCPPEFWPSIPVKPARSRVPEVIA
eukprot:6464970-Amphidinium_carterae.4